MDERPDRVKRVVLYNPEAFRKPYSYSSHYRYGNGRHNYNSRWDRHPNYYNYRQYSNYTRPSSYFHRPNTYSNYTHNSNSFQHGRSNSRNRNTDLNRTIHDSVLSTSTSSARNPAEKKPKAIHDDLSLFSNLSDNEDDELDDTTTEISETELNDLRGTNNDNPLMHLMDSSDEESYYKTEDDETYAPGNSDTASSIVSTSTFHKSATKKYRASEAFGIDIDDDTASQISVASESMLSSISKLQNMDQELYDEMKILVRDQVQREVQMISTSKLNKTSYASREHVDIRQKIRSLMDECFRQKMVVMLSKDPEESLGNIFNPVLRLKLQELMETERDLGVTLPDIGIKYEIKCLMVDNFKETTRIIFLELKEEEVLCFESRSYNISHPSLKQEYIELKVIESRIKQIHKRRIEFIQRQILKTSHTLRHKLMEIIELFMFTTINTKLANLISRIHRLANRNLQNSATSYN